MDEYIEREMAVALIEEKQKELCPVGRYGRGYVYGTDRERYDNWDEIIDALSAIPTADVAPVRHGRWIKKPGQRCSGRYCSECDCHEPCERNFCPNCGAKMNGD